MEFTDLLPLHSSPIKELACSPWKNGHLLSASTDGCLILSSLQSTNALIS
jgi:hypothetical protein